MNDSPLEKQSPGSAPSPVHEPGAAPATQLATQPAALLAAMSEARQAAVSWGREQAAEQARLALAIQTLQAQVDHMHAQLGLAYEDIASMQRERGEALRQTELAHQERDAAFVARDGAMSELHASQQRERSREDLHQAALREAKRLAAAHAEAEERHRIEALAHARARQERQAEAEARQAEAQAHQQTREERDAEHARRNDEQARREAEHQARQQEQSAREQEREQEREQLKELADRNTMLRERLLDVYSQLHARDLPSLILQVCVNLTGSECGLFVEADGDDTLAREGFDELPDFIRDALYEWTRRVAREQEPTHENDGSKLPDHSRLVNLAALPVSLHSELTGVILVANKRDANGDPKDYTDEDTELLLAIGRHASLALENRRLHNELGEAFQGTVAVLADAIEAKDAYTRGHSEGVSDLAVSVARRLGFDEDALRQIRYAALLHDVGKIGVPDGILLKPGRLLPEEFSIIQRHSQIGRDLIARVPSLSHIAPIVMHHHERIDGTGYPNGLSGDAISLASRIICVADAFDAMTTARPYRESVSPQEAIAELRRCSGTHFDPLVVNMVAEVLAESA